MKGKTVEYEIQLRAYNGSAFDTFVKFNQINKSNLYWTLRIIKNGKSFNSLKLFNGYLKVTEKKTVPIFIVFMCGMTDISAAWKRLVLTKAHKKKYLKNKGIMMKFVKIFGWLKQKNG